MRGTNDNNSVHGRYNNTFDHKKIHELKLAKRTLQYLTEGSYYGPSSNDVITDAQFGFQPILGTTEPIFVLHCLVTEKLQNKEMLQCFVDFKKTFDSINREKLYKKLKHYGIQ